MSQALFTDLVRSIRKSKARFFSIIAIVALGISFFAGMKATQPDMYQTAETYFKDKNLMDIRLISTVGLTQTDIYEISQRVRGIEAIMTARFVDGLLVMDGEGLVDIDGSAYTCRAISYDFDMQENDLAAMNRLTLLEGEWPKNPNECVVDQSALSTPDEFVIGATVDLIGDQQNLEDSLRFTSFKIVGIIRTPLYMSFERGNTTIGSGKLGTFVYVQNEAFKTQYYTEAFFKLEGSDEYPVYNEDYAAYVKSVMAEIEAIADERVALRVKSLRKELEPKVSGGKTELAQAEIDAQTALAAARQQVETVKYAAQYGEEALAKKEAELKAKLAAEAQKITNGQSQYNAGVEQYLLKKAEYEAGVAKANANPDAQKKYDDGMKALAEGAQAIKDAEDQLDSLEKSISTAEKFLLTFKDAKPVAFLLEQLEGLGLESELMEQFRAMTAIGIAEEFVSAAMPMLDSMKQETAAGRVELENKKQEYQKGFAELQASTPLIQELQKLPEYKAQLEDAERTLNDASGDLQVGSLQIKAGELELSIEIEKQRQLIKEAKAAYPTVDEDYAKAEKEVYEQLNKARNELAYGEKTLSNLDYAQWMITDRNDLSGYATYQSNALNISALGSILPLVFFAVAAMVCLTTMSRMVEEERTQMGTLKALGYESKIIAVKYLIYALLASLIGSAIGLAIGFTALPIAVTAAFGIMFDMPNVILSFHPVYAIIGVLIALLSTVAAALFGCRKELVSVPAQLMRPKAPKVGKRVLLERIPFIWERLNFSVKVTVRNLFRNKRRLIMTVFGITGCTALLLATFGLSDSVSAIIGYQYGDNGIANFDLQLVLRETQDPDEDSAILRTLREEERLGDVMLTFMKVLNGSSSKNANSLKEIDILVPQSPGMLSDFVKLQNRKTGKTLVLGETEGALITERFAEHCDADVGDEIFIRKSDGTDVTVRVAGIVENYTFHYVYMTRELYEDVFGEEPSFNSAYVKLSDDILAMTGETHDKAKAVLVQDLMKHNDINAVVPTTQIIDTFETIIGSLNLVIIIFLVAAGALAVVVLYNLSNININERIREIATIKVLGFYDKEVSSYMYRENVFLMILGIFFGLLGGSFLHSMISSVVDISVVMLGQNIEWTSYLYAVVMTVVITLLVNLLMHRKLKTVKMVESLKSIE